MSAPDASAPDYTSPAYQDMAKRWTLVRRVRHINETIDTEPATVLPKADAEGQNSWKVRCALTFGFEATNETIHALVGLACRHDPVLGEDVPERIVGDWEDIDLQGTHGSIFTQHCLDSAISDGHGAILADYPPAPEGLTLAQEQAMGLRAYLVLVPADRITAWRVGRVKARMALLMVKLREDKEVPDGAFGTKTVERYRTLYQNLDEQGNPFVTFVVHEKVVANGKEDWIVAEEGRIRGPKWIPVHPFYGGERKGILQSRPPLLGLAYANLEHTQKKSQRAYSLYKTAIAIPVWVNRTGRTDAVGKPTPVEISSDVGIDLDEGGDAFFMEGAGNALAPLRDDTQDIERLMGSQGFSMLRRDQPTQQTATEKTMQATREESKLARAVRSVGDALEAAFGSMAAFYGLEDGGSIELERNFSDIELDPDQQRFLSELESDGKLTLKTMLTMLKAGGGVFEGLDVDAEVQEIARQGAAEPMTVDPAIDPATGQPWAQAA